MRIRQSSLTHPNARKIVRQSVLAVAAVFCGRIASANGDDAAQRLADIKAKLTDLSVGSPMERAVKVDAALKSEDPLLRSYALEQSMDDSDSRVREMAFMAFLKGQKSFFLQSQITDDDVAAVNKLSYGTGDCLGRYRSIQIIIDGIDDKTGHFDATVRGLRWPGTVDRAGISMLTDCSAPTYGSARLTFRGASSGYLIGTISIGSVSLPAKVALQ